MVRLPAFDPVEFLISRKFRSAPSPFLKALFPSGEQSRIPDPPLNEPQQIIRELEYRDALEAMSEAEFEILLDAEKKKLAEELKAQAQKKEDQQFFNQPHACADFEHWSKAAHWTLDEAVALSFGKAPEYVNWTALQPFLKVSQFALRYARLRDLAQRAMVWKKLYDPVLPMIFLGWAKDNDIEFPVALAEKVHARRGSLTDWQKEHEKLMVMYDELKAMYDEHTRQWKEIVEQKSELIGKYHTQIESLRSELEHCRANAEKALQSPPPEKPQSAREREGMLKVIYAMAIWPAPGSEDTELGVFMGPEVRHGAAEVYERVQA